MFIHVLYHNCVSTGLISFKLPHSFDRLILSKALIQCFPSFFTSPFFSGYLKFGFNREEGGIVYREWAPAAQ